MLAFNSDLLVQRHEARQHRRKMKAEPVGRNQRFSWGTLLAVVLMILAGLYATQHPHGFFASLVRVFLSL
jgi:hypothetical protein